MSSTGAVAGASIDAGGLQGQVGGGRPVAALAAGRSRAVDDRQVAAGRAGAVPAHLPPPCHPPPCASAAAPARTPRPRAAAAAAAGSRAMHRSRRHHHHQQQAAALSSLTCGDCTLGSTRPSMPSVKQVVLPLPLWACGQAEGGRWLRGGGGRGAAGWLLRGPPSWPPQPGAAAVHGPPSLLVGQLSAPRLGADKVHTPGCHSR